MKTLYLLRHAKSSWDNPELSDFERPLNKRGHYDAPLMGNLIEKLNILPDLIISSPAIRAAMTSRFVAEAIKYPLDKIRYDENIYDTSESELLEIIYTINDVVNTLMLVGHNPSFTYFSHFIAKHNIHNIPTCGLFGVELNITSWTKVKKNCGKLLLYEYPKKYK
jgi:phosphohistidine phosphatase